MDAGWFVVIGAGVGGALTLFANMISAWQQASTRVHARQMAEQAWIREKLHEIYANLLKQPHNTDDVWERMKWMNILVIYYYDKNSPGFLELKAKAVANNLTNEDVLEIAFQDPRIQAPYAR